MNSGQNSEDIFKLERFNLNAKKLRESKFFNWFLENSLNIEFLVTKDSPRNIFPPDSYLKDFLMTFHKCIIDEHSSINEIAQIYNRLDPNDKLKSIFDDYNEALNKCLYVRPFGTIIKIDDNIRILTLIAILDIFMYGEFIGDQPQKRELYVKITQDREIREFYWFEFYMNIYKCTLLFTQILTLNESLLDKLNDVS